MQYIIKTTKKYDCCYRDKIYTLTKILSVNVIFQFQYKTPLKNKSYNILWYQIMTRFLGCIYKPLYFLLQTSLNQRISNQNQNQKIHKK